MSTRMSRGCYEETAPLEFKLVQAVEGGRDQRKKILRAITSALAARFGEQGKLLAIAR